MLEKTRADLVLGLLILLASILVLFVWIPLDVESGIFEKVRRRTEIGDAFAPVVAASVLLLGSLLLVFEGLKSPSDIRLSWQSLVYVAALFALFVVTMIIMRWTGPLAANMFAGQETGGYRPLRDTVPWKYIGYILGGTLLVTALISFVEQKLTLRSFSIGLAATVFILLIYDLPFDDLVLPPNGDV